MSSRSVLGAGLLIILLHQAGLVLLISVGLPVLAAIAAAAGLFLMLPLWRVLRWAGVPVRLGLGWTAASPGATLWGAAGFLAAVPAVLALTERWTPVPGPLDRFFGELLHAGSPVEWGVVVVVVALIPAVAEESLFRGFLLGGLEPRWGRWATIAGTAVAFGLVHGSTRAPTATALGLLLGWIASRSRSAVPTMVAHAAANAVAIGVANTPAALSGGTDPVPWAMAGASGAVSAGLLALFARSTQRSGPTRPAEDAPWSLRREPDSDRPAST